MSDAWEDARRAAEAVGVRVADLVALDEQVAAVELLRGIWKAETLDQIIAPNLLRALAHSGNYVVGAYAGDRLVGAAVAFRGEGHLHSHITGVVRPGVGFALKQHQRAWCLEREIDDVHWTFDPLVRRNAYFNLQKLGAVAIEYLADFYGAMSDGINAGDASDRLYIRWPLTSPRAIAAARGERAEADLGELRAAGAVTLVDRDGDEPVPRAAGTGAPALLVAVPGDIEALRPVDPGRARAWRYAVRDALTTGLAAGFRVTGMSRDGFYVLRPRRPRRPDEPPPARGTRPDVARRAAARPRGVGPRMSDAPVAALVLAAGGGRRYGGPKALVAYGDRLLVEHAVDVVRAAGCAPIVAVLGAAAAEVRARADLGDARVVENPDWPTGMASSLRAGLAALADTDAVAAVVQLVDTPGVTADAIRRVAAHAGPTALARATYGGRPGHPVLLGRDRWAGLAASVTGDEGARAYLAGHAAELTAVECGDIADGRDVDRPPSAG